jgi:uncharacterized ion transporter superfamily protein YfcC
VVPEQPAQPRVPHVYAIIFSLIVLTAVLSLVVPAGSYQRDADDRVVAGTFAYDREAPQSVPRPRGWPLLFAALQAPLRGIVAVADIIAFILVVGGTFKVMERSGAFDALIRFTVLKLSHRESWVFAAAMLLFSLGGAIFGMSEEVIPFVLLLVPLVRALGYEPVVAVAVPVIGSGVGFAGAMINPFTVQVAQGIAGVEPLSGWRFRTVVWVLLTIIGIAYVLLRARRARTEPEAGHAFDQDKDRVHFTRTHAAVLLSFAAGIGVVLWGVSAHQWYVIEIGAVFLGVGIAAGFLARLGGSDIARSFVAGARELLSAALIVGVARGIVVVAAETRILDTVLHGMASALEPLHGAVSLTLMFFFQSVLNFFLPSGSGQAALTMPIMAPLADLVGLTRQMAVLAYQFGDGFSNMIIPTGVMLMGSLEAAKVPYERWFRFAWLLQLWLLAFGIVALTVAYSIRFS